MLRTSLLARAALVVAALLWAVTASGAYSRLAVFVALFVLSASLASLARGVVQNALVVVAAVLFGVSVIEGAALAVTPRVQVLHPRGLWGARPVLGWGPTAPGRYPGEKRIDGRTIYRVDYTIDRDLLRQTTSAASGPLVAFFGDSITFGEGLNDPDTLPQAFARSAPSLDVVNLAFSAYSPAQVLRELQVRLFAKRIAGARAFVLLTGPWHAERVACKPNFSIRAPRYELVGDALEYRGPCFSGLAQRIEEFYKESAAYQLFLAPILQRPSHRDIETWIAVTAAIAQIAHEQYGAPLVVLYVTPPAHYLDGTGFSDDEIRGRLAAGGAHLIDAALHAGPGETLTIPGDGHPNALANRLQAKKLLDDLEATMPEVLAPAAVAQTPD